MGEKALITKEYNITEKLHNINIGYNNKQFLMPMSSTLRNVRHYTEYFFHIFFCFSTIIRET